MKISSSCVKLVGLCKLRAAQQSVINPLMQSGYPLSALEWTDGERGFTKLAQGVRIDQNGINASDDREMF